MEAGVEVYLAYYAIDGLKMAGVFCYFEIKCFSGYSTIYVFKIRKTQIIAIIAHRDLRTSKDLPQSGNRSLILVMSVPFYIISPKN